MDSRVRSRAQSTTLMPLGSVDRMPNPVGPGCGKTLRPSWTSSTGQPGSDGHVVRVPRAAREGHVPGVDRGGADRRRVGVVRARDHQQVGRQAKLAGDRRQDAADGRGVGLDVGQPGRVDARLGDALRGPATGRDVVGRPGPGVAPVDHGPARQVQGVELVPVHEPARPGRDLRRRPMPPQGPVDRVHAPRHVPRQPEPLLGRATRGGHQRHLVTPGIRGHEARSEGRPVRRDREDLAARGAEGEWRSVGSARTAASAATAATHDRNASRDARTSTSQ